MHEGRFTDASRHYRLVEGGIDALVHAARSLQGEVPRVLSLAQLVQYEGLKRRVQILASPLATFYAKTPHPNGLTPEEIRLTRWHFGLDGEVPLSFELIAKNENTSPDKVKTIIEEAIKKIAENRKPDI